MKLKNIITDLGLIKGRGAIDFVKFNKLTESKMDITFSIDTTKCSQGATFEQYVQMRIISNSLIYFKMQSDELLPKLHPESCLCEIIDSQVVNNNLDIQIYFLFFVFAYAVVFLAINFGVYSIL